MYDRRRSSSGPRNEGELTWRKSGRGSGLNSFPRFRCAVARELGALTAFDSPPINRAKSLIPFWRDRWAAHAPPSFSNRSTWSRPSSKSNLNLCFGECWMLSAKNRLLDFCLLPFCVSVSTCEMILFCCLSLVLFSSLQWHALSRHREWHGVGCCWCRSARQRPRSMARPNSSELTTFDSFAKKVWRFDALLTASVTVLWCAEELLRWVAMRHGQPEWCFCCCEDVFG